MVDTIVRRVIAASRPFVPRSVRRSVRDALPARLWHPTWHRAAVGGLWEEVGRLQFDFLVSQGLRPDHHLLDIGCGSLRGGVRFIGYLEPGHYTGVEKNEKVLEAGRRLEIPRHGVEHRRPLLVAMGNFDFPSLGREFDYALAQSVFTHIPLNDIVRCLLNVDRVLKPGGRFFATFFEAPRKFHLDDITHPNGGVSHWDADPFHYHPDVFRWICEETTLEVEYLGEWNHPRNQRMLVFTKA